MPEVIEVALTAMFLNKKLHNKNITNIQVLGGRYKRYGLDGLDDFKNALPLKIKMIDSKGKFMWFTLENDNNEEYFIMNTYGLEGEWGFRKLTHSNIAFDITDPVTNKKNILYYTDSMNYGTIALTNDKDVLVNRVNTISPDILKVPFSDNELCDRIKKLLFNKSGKLNEKKAKTPIIKILMDQKKGIGSGMGNYLAVEILFESKISPHTPLINIYKNKKLCKTLAESIRRIVKISYMTADVGYLTDLEPKFEKFIKKLRDDIKNDPNNVYNYHPTVVLKPNEKFKFNVYRQKTDPHGYKIKKDIIIKGRTTYWSPEIQK